MRFQIRRPRESVDATAEEDDVVVVVVVVAARDGAERMPSEEAAEDVAASTAEATSVRQMRMRLCVEGEMEVEGGMMRSWLFSMVGSYISEI